MLRRSSRIGFLAATLVLPATAWAQDAPVPPVVTVAPFTGTPNTRDARALADSLAMTLVETRRCRVLPIEWLPASAPDGPRSMREARAAAEAAGVQYIVTGDVHTSVRPMAWNNAPPGFPGLRRMPPAPRGGQRAVGVTLRVIDVASGATVRSVIGSGGDAGNGRSPLPVIAALLLHRPALAALPFVARRPSNNRAVDRALAEAAEILTIPAPPNPIR